MNYTLRDVFEKISQMIDVVYLIDTSSDTYTALKDNELFHSTFGSSGSYNKMMYSFIENTVDKLVSKSTPYGIFLEGDIIFTGNLANNARMRIGDKEVTISISTYPIDDTINVLLINEIEQEEYNYLQEIQKEQQIKAIKSAYLFTMDIDLITDKCGNVNMSEVSDMPVNQPEIKYTEWRKTILNMFPPEDHETFNKISDPAYLKENLQFSRSKSVDCQMMNLEGKYIYG